MSYFGNSSNIVCNIFSIPILLQHLPALMHTGKYRLSESSSIFSLIRIIYIYVLYSGTTPPTLNVKTYISKHVKRHGFCYWMFVALWKMYVMLQTRMEDKCLSRYRNIKHIVYVIIICHTYQTDTILP